MSFKMNNTEINTLRILEALAYDQIQSQRDLAGKLGVSLGLVNAMLKGLVKEGYFRIENVHRSKRYLMTSKGFTEKSFLTYRYVEFAITIYQDMQKRLRSIILELRREGKDKIVIFGKGELTEIASTLISENDLHLVDVIDQAAQLHDLDYDIILILELKDHLAVEMCLLECGIDQHKILRL